MSKKSLDTEIRVWNTLIDHLEALPPARWEAQKVGNGAHKGDIVYRTTINQFDITSVYHNLEVREKGSLDGKYITARHPRELYDRSIQLYSTIKAKRARFDQDNAFYKRLDKALSSQES